MAGQKSHSFANKINRLQLPLWLIIFLGILFILRIPSLFEPYSYGDEMIYLSLGEAIRRGMVLYKEIHDNKPPLLYFMAAISGNLFWFRAILALWMMATTALFWKLTTRVFPKKASIQKIATVVFGLLTTLPLLEGNIANAELFMISFSILGFYWLLQEKLSNSVLLLGGACFSLSALFKIPAAFDLPALFAFWIITTKYTKKLPVQLIKNIAFVSIGFLVPIAVTFVWYAARGAFVEYLVSAFGQNIGYLSSWRPDDAQSSFFVKNGPLLTRAAITAVGILFLWLARKRLSAGFILATAWVLLTLFAVTLSERPYPHYLIQSVPAVALLIGILSSSKRMEQAYTVIPLALVVIVPVYYKFYYYSSFSYYQRFWEFASRQITKEEYFNKFDGNVSRNYKVAQFIQDMSKRNDKVFVWGDSTPIYDLSRRLPPLRYVATYHINDFSTYQQVMTHLENDNPTFIVVLPQSPEFSELNLFLAKNYTQITTIDNVPIYKKLTDKMKGVILKVY